MGYAGALVAALIGTGCYSPSALDCSYTCKNKACPSGLHCVKDFCREDPNAGDVCMPGDGGPGDARSTYRDAVMASGPTAYWRFAELSAGLPAHDEVTGAPDGAYFGAVNLGQAGATSDSNTAAAFLPNLGIPCMEVAPSDAMSLNIGANAAFTIEAWIKMTAVPGSTETIAGKRGATSGNVAGYGLVLVPSGPKAELRVSTGNGTTLSGSSLAAAMVLDVGVWYHVAATCNASGDAVVYVDGQADLGQRLAVTSTENADPFTVGCRVAGAGTSEGYSGFIDEVAVYRKALTGYEIGAHLNAR